MNSLWDDIVELTGTIIATIGFIVLVSLVCYGFGRLMIWTLEKEAVTCKKCLKLLS